jgi:hypothetical protein
VVIARNDSDAAIHMLLKPLNRLLRFARNDEQFILNQMFLNRSIATYNMTYTGMFHPDVLINPTIYMFAKS